MTVKPSHILGCSSNDQIFSSESDPAGNVLTVWTESSPGLNQSLIKASFLMSGGKLSDPIILSNPDSFSISPMVEMDESGNAIVLWRSINAEKQFYFLESSKLLSGSNSWSKPEIITEVDELLCTNCIELKISVNGQIMVLWGRIITDESNPTVQSLKLCSSTSTFNTSWSVPNVIGDLIKPGS
jgi:hypothetical protein